MGFSDGNSNIVHNSGTIWQCELQNTNTKNRIAILQCDVPLFVRTGSIFVHRYSAKIAVVKLRKASTVGLIKTYAEIYINFHLQNNSHAILVNHHSSKA